MRVVVGMTGASGAVYGVTLLQVLRDLGVETHLVATENGLAVLKHEIGIGADELGSYATRAHDNHDFFSPLASGSFPVDAVCVVPCSMHTLASIASGLGENLLCRAADVALKEARPLILVPRETPLSVVHLENMLRAARAGARVLPASPGFYHGPRTVDDLVFFVVGRVLDLLGLEHEVYRRWQGHQAGGIAPPAN